MIATLPDNLITPLRSYIKENLGLDFSVRHTPELLRKIGYAANDFGYSNPNGFIEWLLVTTLTPEQTGLLANHLTIGETYFQREKKGFDFLEQIYLPGLIHKRVGADKRLRVWCAGSATGEEAYSLAIVLLQSIPDIRHWDVSILATDINARFLEKARRGIYTRWSFRKNPESFVSKYFRKAGTNEFHVNPEIRQMVTFSPLNLAGDAYPSEKTGTNGMDIIFCRNVLIYFSQETVRHATDRFYDSLNKGGVLVVSPVEMSMMITSKFGRISYSGFTVYQKGLQKQEEKPTPVPLYPLTRSDVLYPTPVVTPGPDIPADGGEGFKRLCRLLPERTGEHEGMTCKKTFADAQALFGQGNFEEAEEILSALLNEEGSDKKELLPFLAKTKANLGKLQEADDLCEQAVTYDKLDPLIYYLQATIHQELGNDEKAIHLLNRAIYLDPDFVLAHFLLGTLWMKAGNQQAGFKSFRQANCSLAKLKNEDILPESDGLTVGRFTEMLKALQ